MNRDMTDKLHRFNYLACEIDALYHEAARRLGLSDSALRVLYSICDQGDSCLLSEIYKLSGISKQTVNSALRKLEREGTVYLKSHDGRAKTVFLTERGREVAADTAARLIALEHQICGAWPEEELDLYLELTARYAAAFRKGLETL